MLIGGAGKKRTPALAARYADEFNLPFVDEDDHEGPVRSGSATACEAQDRDPATMRWSNALVLCVGADEAELDRRAAAIGRDKAELRENGLAGTVRRRSSTRSGGTPRSAAERLYLQVLDLSDLDHLRLVARDVMPHVG